MTVSSFDPAHLAGVLHRLRSDARTAPTAEFPLPADLAEGSAAQAELAKLEGALPGVYKVAMTPDKVPVVAPLHPYVETACDADLPYVPGMRLEVELAVRLGKDLPIRDEAYSRAEIYAAVAEVHLGVELLSPAVAEAGKVSFPLYLADRIGNRGYALGPVVPKTLLDSIGGTDLIVSEGETVIATAPARHGADDPLLWLTAYANEKARPADVLAAGTVITTGALPGPLPLSGPGVVKVLLAGEHAINVTLTAG